MINVTLTEEEAKYAKEVADKRSRHKEGYSSTNRWQADGNYHYHGVLGELAYAKQYGVPLDTISLVCGDDGSDLTILSKTVDVKTVNYDPPILKISKLSEFTCDLLALALRRSDTDIALYGFATPQIMNAHYQARDFGHGKRMCLDAKHLFF